MGLIGLITDWQQSDYFAGAVKGAVYSLRPEARVIDISHTIGKFNILQAAFVLRSCYFQFPEETVFIIGVKSCAKEDEGYLCIKYGNRYILTANNGIFSLFSDQPFDTAVVLDYMETTFPEKDIFAKYACMLAAKKPVEELGKITMKIHSLLNMLPSYDNTALTGNVVYIDNYGNAITNISKDLFDRVCNNRKFVIYPGNKEFPIYEISRNYNDNENNEADLIALFNSLELLEIANVYLSASQLIRLEVNTNIRIQFYDTQNS